MILYCHHYWTEWARYSLSEEAPIIKICNGICRKTWKHGDPEPRVIVAQTED